MRIAIITGFLAVLVYAGLVAKSYFDFGSVELQLHLLTMIIGGWVALNVILGVINMVRNAATSRPADVPSDVAREIQRHPDD